jgi:hypothetical protein
VPSSPRNVRIAWTSATSARIEWDRPIDADRIVVRGYLVSHGADMGISIDGEHANVYTLKNLGSAHMQVHTYVCVQSRTPSMYYK